MEGPVDRPMRGGADWLRPDPADDHVLGGESADLFLVEYGDFECPYSRAAYQSVQEALRRFDGRLLFAFRHFPLTEIHPHAMAASLAAEAAAAQGKYWPMHDELFARQDALDESGLRSIAGAVGLETSAFEADRDSERARDRVRRDVESGTRAQVPGTPALFIDGRLHAGSYREDALAAALEQSGAAGAAPE